MNNVMDGVLYLRDQYEYALLLADKRVANWLLMDSYLPTLLLTLTYLLSIFVGTVLMRNREPFNFKYTLFFYNASLVALNFHIFYELATVTWKLNYSYTCQLVDYSEDPDEMRIQFIVGMAHAANSIISGCQFPLWMQWALIGYGFSILTLFLNFYFQAYIKPSKVKKQKLKTNGTTHISNGFTNGYINEKKLN
ncbi:hypothetical protein LSH36_255g04101 [Paralvinella palmiformis]|uniref:Elongation of very long chain fatty acids protein n=1 Tax=Paralvinella palmiformis TaxID=53620 RepID=A0AAD9JKH2_9ANNE|nr:hypothetical protein LSH36_255g04101 [Paralvinella palmiformis]